jgi:hypothetical protein
VRALAVTVTVLASVTAAAQAQSWRLGDFTTDSTVFVDVPGSPIRFTTDAGTVDLILLSAEFRGVANREPGLEFYVGPTPTQAAWGRATVATDATAAFSTWSYLDFSGPGVPRVLDLRIRSTVAQEAVTVSEPRITRIPLAASGVLTREVFPTTFVDAGSWSELLGLSVPRAGAWVLLGAATASEGQDAGLAIRIRAGAETLPRPAPTEAPSTSRSCPGPDGPSGSEAGG